MFKPLKFGCAQLKVQHVSRGIRTPWSQEKAMFLQQQRRHSLKATIFSDSRRAIKYNVNYLL